VILELDDADRLEPGDVLVTTMTSPSWTPLFGLAAAVVTDAGDALSHVAIAAREYGIPCVAGTALATVRLRDGVRVVVDGDAGTVRAEPGR
jgi:pyruvate,water dikinase